MRARFGLLPVEFSRSGVTQLRIFLLGSSQNVLVAIFFKLSAHPTPLKSLDSVWKFQHHTSLSYSTQLKHRHDVRGVNSVIFTRHRNVCDELEMLLWFRPSLILPGKC